MIEFENVEVFGWEAAIRGMRNPLNSWDNSDSWYGCKCGDYGKTEAKYCDEHCTADCTFCIGPNDLDLMKKLIAAGSDHSKFMRMINVTCDITAPLYWWAEYDTYKVGTVRNSCSKMHKIHSKEITLDDFSFEDFGAYMYDTTHSGHYWQDYFSGLGTALKADNTTNNEVKAYFDRGQGNMSYEDYLKSLENAVNQNSQSNNDTALLYQNSINTQSENIGLLTDKFSQFLNQNMNQI